MQSKRNFSDQKQQKNKKKQNKKKKRTANYEVKY